MIGRKGSQIDRSETGFKMLWEEWRERHHERRLGLEFSGGKECQKGKLGAKG